MKTESLIVTASATALRVDGSAHSTNKTQPTPCSDRQIRALAQTIVLMLVLSAALIPAANAQTFDAPGAGTSAFLGTIGISMNTAGTVTGFYISTGTVYHGFVRAANGSITTFDVTGAGTGKNQGTYPFSINTAGEIVGMYADASNGYHGFLRSKKGTITTFDVPGAGAGHLGTAAASVNTAGVIAGMYRDASLVHHGFVRAANGTITAPIDAPGAGTGTYQGTEPLSINTAGVITGFYIDGSGVHHGFVRAANGTITTIDAPGAGTGVDQGTSATSINTAGVISGFDQDSSNVYHAFVRSASGTVTTFEAPGAGLNLWLAMLKVKVAEVPTQGTGGISINTAGDIAGTYADSSVVVHGFVRATNGTLTAFSIPGAGTGTLQGTVGVGINTSGAVTGTYLDSSSVFHGFVLSPTKVTISSSLNPSTSGQSVTFTAVVTSKPGAPANGETVTFMFGSNVLGTGVLNAGSATLTTSALPVGKDAITAIYGGDSILMGSTSKALNQVVKKAAE
jgi:predicted membrane protein